MIIQIINENVEERLSNDLQALHALKPVGQCIIQIKLSNIGLKLKAEEVIPEVKEVLTEDKQGKIYICTDGDIFIFWKGSPSDTSNKLQKGLSILLNAKKVVFTPEVFHYYDFQAHKEKLWEESQKKLAVYKQSLTADKSIANSTVPSTVNKPVISEVKQLLQITPKHQAQMKNSLMNKKSRQELVALIVEDQIFSCTILKQILLDQFTCNICTDSMEALEMYSQSAPDIVFQDIDMPDVDGHTLAQFYRKLDPNSYIVMVTANNFPEEVISAKKNMVKDFIVKPYTKQRIMNCINNYFKAKK